jgi:hypothetical protein
MSEDADLGPLAKQDLEKIDLSLADVMSKASRVLLPGRSFDANNAQLEVQAGKLFPNNFLRLFSFFFFLSFSFFNSISQPKAPASSVSGVNDVIRPRGQGIFRLLNLKFKLHYYVSKLIGCFPMELI